MRLVDPDDPFGFAAARRVLTGVAVTLALLAVVRHFRTGEGEAVLVWAAVAVLVVTWSVEPIARGLRRVGR